MRNLHEVRAMLMACVSVGASMKVGCFFPNSAWKVSVKDLEGEERGRRVEMTFLKRPPMVEKLCVCVSVYRWGKGE